MAATIKALGLPLFLLLLQSAVVVRAEYCNRHYMYVYCPNGCCGTSCCLYTYNWYSIATNKFSVRIIGFVVAGCVFLLCCVIACIMACVKRCFCRTPAPAVYTDQECAPTTVISNSTAMTAEEPTLNQQFPMTPANNPQTASPPQQGAQFNAAFSRQQPPAYTEKY